MAATRAWAAPIRLAIRELSWLPNTQFGQPYEGNNASYRSMACAKARACQGSSIK
jgi:hypothetical protein